MLDNCNKSVDKCSLLRYNINMESKRNTEQKRIIMNALMQADHPTASELYERIREDNPHLSRATVFRVLGQFADDGVVRRLNLLGSDTRFDARTAPHAHCHCVRCGRVTDVFAEDFAPVMNSDGVAGYKVLSTEIEFSGICPDCLGTDN